VRKLILKTYDFVDISNAMIPTMLGGSTTTSPPIVVVILRQQLDYFIVDYAASDKSYVFLFQELIFIYLSPHLTLGGSTMNNHLAYH
jgi:hypothetical protein